jgi:hypothetical protein
MSYPRVIWADPDGVMRIVQTGEGNSRVPGGRELVLEHSLGNDSMGQPAWNEFDLTGTNLVLYRLVYAVARPALEALESKGAKP